MKYNLTKGAWMDRSLFRFIIRYSKRDQLLIVPLVVATMVVYYLSLDLPKTIINQAIQGGRFPQPDATTRFLGMELGRLDYLLALSLIFLGLIVLNGWLKYQINTMKGWMGERMLRRLRYVLFDHILRFPLTRFRRVKAAEMATMVKDEVEPLGGFIGEALITPLFLGGQALTALFFILYQHAALGMIALGVVAVQAFMIPKLRRRLLVLGRERQLTARALAGRIAEVVDGAAEIHANDTSNYERAEISARLGRIFRIRFEFYQRKFLIKFLNNFLSQVTPFLFYTVGGYLVIVGRLDIGALVAVIAAYKDLPTPVKELIDWDQQRMDVQIKYQQVMEVFTEEQVEPPERQALIETPQLPQKGRLRVSNLSLVDEGGARLVNDVSFECALEQHVGIVGRHGAGTSELALLLARLVPPSGGSVEMGGIDITRAPEAVTGRALGFVGAPAYLFPVSVRDNVLFGLRHRPLRARTYEGEAAREHEFQLHEAKRTGGSVLDVNADWIDYDAAGVADAEALEARVIALLSVVDLEETIFELGLRSAPDSERNPGLAEQVLAARQHMRERLKALELENWVERFDPARYNRNATLAENLLFGTPVGRTFDMENLAANAYVRRVLHETGMYELTLRAGFKVAETMVELFSGLPPGHEFFAQYSFIHQDELPRFEAILQRVQDVGLKGLAEDERQALLALPFKLIAARHRLGLIDEGFEARVIEARRHFADHLPRELRGAIEFFDPARYNSAASLQDNILFGKIVTGQAEATTRITALVRELLEELGLRPLVVKIGLDYQVGVGGARLAPADRQKIALVRALLKRPVLLILDQATAVLDPASQQRVLDGILEERKGRGVAWVLHRAEIAARFDPVLVMDRGRLVEQGAYETLKCNGGTLHKMLGGH
jgi:putative ABC transport system ATP-binding protein